jgi:hypothetical protein
VLLVAASACSAPATAPTPALAPTTAAAAKNPAAPKPSNVTLKIVSPKAGDALPAGPIKVTLNYSGPPLVPGAQATKLDDYHLHYFLDEDAAPYPGGTAPVPVGNPRIVHSAAQEVTFENVPTGAHTVTVVMSGNNHVSVTPPLSESVAFTTK